MKAGRDITEGFSKFINSIADWFRARPEKNVRKVYSNKGKPNSRTEKVQPKHDQAKMDQILDKISRSGYESLTKEEKDYLFKIGQE